MVPLLNESRIILLKLQSIHRTISFTLFVKKITRNWKYTSIVLKIFIIIKMYEMILYYRSIVLDYSGVCAQIIKCMLRNIIRFPTSDSIIIYKRGFKRNQNIHFSFTILLKRKNRLKPLCCFIYLNLCMSVSQINFQLTYYSNFSCTELDSFLKQMSYLTLFVSKIS